MSFIPSLPFFVKRIKAKVQFGFETAEEQNLLKSFISNSKIDHAYSFQRICEGRHIDAGAFGLVFTKAELPGQVIKVVMEKDRGYQKWVEGFVLQNQGNPFVPRISSYARLNTGQIICIWNDLISILAMTLGYQSILNPFMQIFSFRNISSPHKEGYQERLPIFETIYTQSAPLGASDGTYVMQISCFAASKL
jgi:hypothetical protein